MLWTSLLNQFVPTSRVITKTTIDKTHRNAENLIKFVIEKIESVLNFIASIIIPLYR